MLQDNDPLWKAIKDALDSFDLDTIRHGGLIRSETIKFMSLLRLQLHKDRLREARARVGLRTEVQS